MQALILVEAEKGGLRDLGQRLSDVDGVRVVYSVTGEWDFVAIVHLGKHQDLARIVTTDIAGLQGVAHTKTMVAFEVFSEHDLEGIFSIGS
jgi:DNA-binding Lrp family transcriptional regulator